MNTVDGYLYLASPFSAYPHGHDQAHFDICSVAAVFLRAGIHVFAPIAYGFAIAKIGNIGTDHIAWRAFNETMMAHSDGVVIVCLDGWQDSEGVRDEIAFARQTHLPLLFWKPGMEPPGTLQLPTEG